MKIINFEDDEFITYLDSTSSKEFDIADRNGIRLITHVIKSGYYDKSILLLEKIGIKNLEFTKGFKEALIEASTREKFKTPSGNPVYTEDASQFKNLLNDKKKCHFVNDESQRIVESIKNTKIAQDYVTMKKFFDEAHKGMELSILVRPALEWLDNKVTAENSDKSLFSYYFDEVKAIPLTAAFIISSYALNMPELIMAGKLAMGIYYSDKHPLQIIWNSALSVSFVGAIGYGIKFASTNPILKHYPLTVGLVSGCAPELISLAYHLAEEIIDYHVEEKLVEFIGLVLHHTDTHMDVSN